MDVTAATTELKARGFNFLSDARALIMLNRGKNAFERLAPWPWLEANATGTGTVTINDLRAVMFVQNTGTDLELQGATRDYLRQQYEADLTTAGTAEHWWLDGQTTLRVFPVQAGAALSVDYIKWSPELSAGADTPLIPVREHPVWIEFSVVEAYRDSDNFEAANALRADLLNVVVPELVSVYCSRNLQNPAYQVIQFASEDW